VKQHAAMSNRQTYLAIFGATAAVLLAACGGGGGGSGGTPATPTPLPSVSGDMLALVSGRGWNYQTQGASGSGPFTASLYTNVHKVNGNTFILVGTAVPGLVATVLTDAQTAENNAIGKLGIVPSSSGYNVVSYVSAGGSGPVPNNPLLVPNTLTLNQTWSADGVTATVTAVGSMPNANVCPSPATGASVQYSGQGQNITIDYVPGCGMTRISSPAAGATIDLISVGDYSFIGDLSALRRTEPTFFGKRALSP
jgi:hypothetical protein